MTEECNIFAAIVIDEITANKNGVCPRWLANRRMSEAIEIESQTNICFSLAQQMAIYNCFDC